MAARAINFPVGSFPTTLLSTQYAHKTTSSEEGDPFPEYSCRFLCRVSSSPRFRRTPLSILSAKVDTVCRKNRSIFAAKTLRFGMNRSGQGSGRGVIHLPNFLVTTPLGNPDNFPDPSLTFNYSNGERSFYSSITSACYGRGLSFHFLK